MIFHSNQVQIMVATKPIDFRKGHDSLAAMVKNELRKDPSTGTDGSYDPKSAGIRERGDPLKSSDSAPMLGSLIDGGMPTDGAFRRNGKHLTA